MTKQTTKLATRSNSVAIAHPIDTAKEQATALQKVLISYAPWRKVTAISALTLGEAKAVLIAVREVRDTAEKGRKALTAPLNAEKKAIDATYKPIAEVCDAYDEKLTALMLAFEEVERAKLIKESEKQAKALDRKGAGQAAADMREMALAAPLIEGSGISTQEVWHAEVTDLRALLAAILAGDEPLALVEPNMTMLNARARSPEKPETAGVKFVCEKIVKRS